MRRSDSKSVSTAAVVAVLALTVFAASGCRWFRKDTGFEQSADTRPLEVPPDLDRPNTDAALGATGSVSRSSLPGAARPAEASSSAAAAAPTAQAPAAGAGGFTVQGERDAVFAKVGDALAATQGVTIASRAQLLGTYDVSYEGSSFLVRVTPVEAGVYVSAVDPRGVVASGPAATKLIAALKTALGG